MNVYKLKHIKKATEMSKKEIKEILMESNVITASWAVKEDKGLVVELHEPDGNFTETTLLYTDTFLTLLCEGIKEWRESHV